MYIYRPKWVRLDRRNIPVSDENHLNYFQTVIPVSDSEPNILLFLCTHVKWQEFGFAQILVSLLLTFLFFFS